MLGTLYSFPVVFMLSNYFSPQHLVVQMTTVPKIHNTTHITNYTDSNLLPCTFWFPMVHGSSESKCVSPPIPGPGK